jgi:hypothetical protein
MFGPVPAKYSVIVWLCGLAVFAGLGAWLSPSVPFSASVMSAIGLSCGAAVVVLFLHDFRHQDH